VVDDADIPRPAPAPARAPRPRSALPPGLAGVSSRSRGARLPSHGLRVTPRKAEGHEAAGSRTTEGGRPQREPDRAAWRRGGSYMAINKRLPMGEPPIDLWVIPVVRLPGKMLSESCLR
jgi:hypothetical protein